MPRVPTTTRSGCRRESTVVAAHRQPRVVGEHGAGAHHDGVHPLAHRVHLRARHRPRDPPAGAVGGGDPAVEARGVLPRDVRPPGAFAVQPRPQGPARDLLGQQPGPDLHPGCAQHLRTTRRGGMRIGHGEVHRGHTGVEQRPRARRSPAVMRTRFQRDHGGTADSPLTRLAQRHHLGVRAGWRLGGTRADHPSVRVEDHRPHGRVRAGGAAHVVAEGERGLHRRPHGVAGRRGCRRVHRARAALAWSRNAATARAGSSAP